MAPQTTMSKTITDYFILTSGSILALFILVPFWIYKSFIKIIASLLHPGWSIITPNDSLVVGDPFPTRNIIGSTSSHYIQNLGLIICLQGDLDLESFRAKFRNLFLGSNGQRAYPKLQSTWVKFGGYTFWEPLSSNAFDEETHFTQMILPESQTLDGFLGGWISEGYRKSWPLWTVTLVKESASANDEVNICIRIHHSIGDGSTLIHMMDTLADAVQNGDKASLLGQKNAAVPDKDNFLKKVKLLSSFPRSLLNLQREVNQVATFGELFPIQSRGGPGAFICRISLPSSELKEIRRKFNVHVISIYVSCLLGALIRLESEDDEFMNFPEFTSVSLSLPWPGHPRLGTVNHWTAGMVHAPLKNSTPVSRLKALEKSYQEMVDKGYDVLFRKCTMEITSLFPTALIQTEAYFKSITAKVAFSNNMASSEPYSIDGIPIKCAHAISGNLTPNFGELQNPTVHNLKILKEINGHGMSVSGLVNISICGSRALIKSQKRMEKISRMYFIKEFRSLLTE